MKRPPTHIWLTVQGGDSRRMHMHTARRDAQREVARGNRTLRGVLARCQSYRPRDVERAEEFRTLGPFLYERKEE